MVGFEGFFKSLVFTLCTISIYWNRPVSSTVHHTGCTEWVLLGTTIFPLSSNILSPGSNRPHSWTKPKCWNTHMSTTTGQPRTVYLILLILSISNCSQTTVTYTTFKANLAYRQGRRQILDIFGGCYAWAKGIKNENTNLNHSKLWRPYNLLGK